MKKRPAKAYEDEPEQNQIAGVGDYWSGPIYPKRRRVKEVRIYGFIRPKVKRREKK